MVIAQPALSQYTELGKAISVPVSGASGSVGADAGRFSYLSRALTVEAALRSTGPILNELFLSGVIVVLPGVTRPERCYLV